jgi:type I restriction enzyme R subunit
LQTYKEEIADLFVSNEALVISDGLHARIGSLTASRERFLPWRTVKNENDRPLLEFELEKVVRGFFAPALLLDYLRYFVLFETADGQVVKKIAGYHQFHAVRAAVKAAVIAATQPAPNTAQEQWATYAERVKPGSRMGGIVWHTQGSGKSISMVCFAAKLMQQKAMQNPTLVVVTDRNDLDGQLFQTFVGARSLLRETPQQATNRDELRALLAGRPSGGIIFTTVQKFTPEPGEEEFPLLRPHQHRRHRRRGAPLAIRLPRRAGQEDRPVQVRLRQASARRAEERHLRRLHRHAGGRRRQGHPRRVRRLRQHLRHPGRGGRRRHGAHLLRKPPGQAGPQPGRDGTAQRRRGRSVRGRGRRGAEGSGQDPWAALEKLVGAQPRIEQVAADIVQHFEARNGAVEGKAMIVAMSREICARLYAAIVALRPAWHSDDPAQGAIKVVMTGSAADTAHCSPTSTTPRPRSCWRSASRMPPTR